MLEVFLQEAATLQDDFEMMLTKKRMTKKAICDLWVSFRDKYGLSDSQTLLIARRGITLTQIITLFKEISKNGEH